MVVVLPVGKVSLEAFDFSFGFFIGHVGHLLDTGRRELEGWCGDWRARAGCADILLILLDLVASIKTSSIVFHLPVAIVGTKSIKD